MCVCVLSSGALTQLLIDMPIEERALNIEGVKIGTGAVFNCRKSLVKLTAM